MDMETARRVAFQQLRPLCSCLMQHRNDVPELSDALRKMDARLHALDRDGLQGCSDYVLFPLLFIVDSIYAVRNESGESYFAISFAIGLHCP